MNHLTNPEIEQLLLLLKEYDEIIKNHNMAMIISLSERRRIQEERRRINDILVEERKKVFLGG